VGFLLPTAPLMQFEYAVEQGVPGAMWKLGRMYAASEGCHMRPMPKRFARLFAGGGRPRAFITPSAERPPRGRSRRARRKAPRINIPCRPEISLLAITIIQPRDLLRWYSWLTALTNAPLTVLGNSQFPKAMSQ
jgi:hypothetical protein